MPADPRACACKHRYPDETSARAVARKRKAAAGVELRVYACTDCGGYHLTKLGAAPRRDFGPDLPPWRPPTDRRHKNERRRGAGRRRG